jgi:hypothetical protein
METENKNTHEITKKFISVISLILVGATLVFIIFNETQLHFTRSLLDFAAHHYFLTGFILITLLVLFMKSQEPLSKKLGMKIRNRRSSSSNRYSKMFKNNVITPSTTHELNVASESDLVMKDDVKNLKFPNIDVLRSEAEILKRNEDLLKAMKLGNTFKHKVKLFFKDIHSNKHVVTTVWHTNSNHISLKGGIVIPVRSIYKIEI